MGDATPTINSKIRNISQKELDIDLGDFRKTTAEKLNSQAYQTKTSGEALSKGKKADEMNKEEQECSVRLDERYFEASKALADGDLSKY